MESQVVGAIIGYARTSTIEQEAGLEAQIAELKAMNCARIYSEQVSSIADERPKLTEALSYLREGDTFVVTKPDRLARSVIDMLTIVDDLTKRGVGVRIMSMGLDTGNATGRLMLTILAGVAEWERCIMLERQRAGVAKAKSEGKYKGRAPTARRKSAQVIAMDADEIGPAEIARRLNISPASVYRILNDEKQKVTA